ncbi:MAG: 2-C-methyl-D-erythritol 4-phosphate cytidylyltransferase [Trueperaceae bacterium]|nr:2-C-methyl-D-erythritol 4-phosphate cytidylyltransferase [Trueperaceae bacterium]
MAERVAALVPAAGQGTRLGLGPKAFVPLAGRPLLVWAVRALAPWVDEVVVAVPEAALGEAAALLAGAAGTTPVRCVAGGATRQETVERLALATEAEIVLVHDAARPFLDAAIVRAATAAARKHGACSVAVAVTDTLVRASDGGAVDRSALLAVQTPQGFRRELLLRAHAHARAAGTSATDDAGLVRALGAEVAWVPGSAQLFKVTGPDDLALAEAWAGTLAAADGRG